MVCMWQCVCVKALYGQWRVLTLWHHITNRNHNNRRPSPNPSQLRLTFGPRLLTRARQALLLLRLLPRVELQQVSDGVEKARLPHCTVGGQWPYVCVYTRACCTDGGSAKPLVTASEGLETFLLFVGGKQSGKSSLIVQFLNPNKGKPVNQPASYMCVKEEKRLRASKRERQGRETCTERERATSSLVQPLTLDHSCDAQMTHQSPQWHWITLLGGGVTQPAQSKTLRTFGSLVSWARHTEMRGNEH